MSGDAAPGLGQKKVTLLSHYLVDARRYCAGNSNQPITANNTWPGSELQTWLNDANGFLKDYTTPVKAVLISPSPDGIVGSKMTLPSLASHNGQPYYSAADFFRYVYSGDLNLWFGPNDFSQANAWTMPVYGVHSLARMAWFKNPASTWDYWTRSPVLVDSRSAWQISIYGSLVYANTLSGITQGIRPVCVIDLGSVVFKSGVDNFELSAPSGQPAGAPDNPYVLVLSGDIPDGMTVKFISADMPPLGCLYRRKNTDA